MGGDCWGTSEKGQAQTRSASSKTARFPVKRRAGRRSSREKRESCGMFKGHLGKKGEKRRNFRLVKRMGARSMGKELAAEDERDAYVR